MLCLLVMVEAGKKRSLGYSRCTSPDWFCFCVDQDRRFKRWKSLRSLRWSLYSFVRSLVVAR